MASLQTIIIFLIFSSLGIFLAIIARSDNAIAYLGFLWSRGFQYLLEIAIFSALCLLILRRLTHRALPNRVLKIIYGIIFLVILTGVLHLLTNMGAHRLKLKKVPR